MTDVEFTLVDELSVAEKKLSPLVDEYRNEVIKLNPLLVDLRILGSFGTGNEQGGSDLDSWLVPNGLLNLRDLSILSRKEFEIKQKLSIKYGYPNLARHRATILSKDQTYIYEKSFAIRVGIPHDIGVVKSIIDNNSHNLDVKLHPTDLIATLKEYKGLYDRNVLRGNPLLPRKYTRRIIQDTWLYFNKNYITKNGKLDEIIKNNFYDSDEAVIQKSIEIVNELSKEVSPKQIYCRELSHQCLQTMEKVVWELSRSYFSKRAFDEWRLGKNRHGGFYPTEIRELVDEFNNVFQNILPSTNLFDSLAKLEKSDSGIEEAEEYYQIHCKWMLEAGNIAFKASEGWLRLVNNENYSPGKN